MRAVRALVVGILLATSGVAVGCSGGVVGGECRQGYGVCEGRCIDVRFDSENCGACGHACGASEACASGVCTSSDSGSVSGSGGSSGLDASAGGSSAASGGAGGLSGSGGAIDAGAGGISLDGAIRDGSSSGTGGTGGGPDASAGTGGSVDASVGGTGGVGGAGGASGSGGTAGAGGSGGTSGMDAGSCPPPYDTALQCGNCYTRCTGATPICSYGGEGYFCTSFCTAPLVQCGTQCVNTDNDENNCGKCGHRCASGICQGGVCVGATAGHEVLICMDYRARAQAGTPQEQILENAVFLGSKSNVRILEYHQYSLASVVTTVGQTLDSAAVARGRTYTATVAATGADVANQLSVFDDDVLLVLDQPNAPAGALASIGSTWQGPVESFVRAGGTVIVLAGDGGRAEMSQFLTSAGLLTVTGQNSVTGNQVYDRALGDVIGVNVLTPFRAPRETCTFTTPPPDPAATFVVTDAPSSSGTLGSPVVVHRVLTP